MNAGLVSLRNGMGALALLVLAVAVPVQAATVQLVTNGDFEQNLSGWNLAATANGTTRTSNTPGNADIDGDGTRNAALRLQVGKVSFTASATGGVTLSQVLTVTKRSNLTFGADIMALSTSNNGNLDFGQFGMSFGATLVDAFSFGQRAGNSTNRSVLSGFLTNVLPGTYTLSISILRGYTTTNTTPFQYVDDISVQASAVPLPAPALMLIAGLGGMALVRRRRASAPV